MRPLTCFVVDDEPLALELMESYVRKTPFLRWEGSFDGGAAVFEALQRKPVDLLFCDIQMPGLTGMELSRMLPRRTRVIFTTAYSQYALEGFRVSALDYLLKPVSYEDFLSAARKAEEWFVLQDRPAEEPASAAPHSLIVKADYQLRQIDMDDILYVEGMKDYVRIFLESDPVPVMPLMSLKTLSAQLPEDRFFRVSKSYIVQLSKIRTIERSRIVFGNVYIPISEQVREAFFGRLSRCSIMTGE